MKLIDLGAQYKSAKKAVDAAIKKVLTSGNFILGEHVRKLEEKIAALVGTKYAIGVNSGTDALLLSLKALGIKKGDEVITSPFTFVATGEVIAALGATPVFVDIDPDTYNIDPKLVEQAITKKTRAIIPVHLYGQMVDMDVIMRIAKKYNLFVIEDAAQALGAKQKTKQGIWRMAGGVGHAGCFSFFPTKNLGAFGDGGMITTNDARLAEKLRMMRNHGSKRKYYHEFLGTSSRLDEIHAAVLLAKLPYLKEWNEARRKHALSYSKRLAPLQAINVPHTVSNNYHIFHQYTLRVAQRDMFQDHLKQAGVPTAVHYPIPLHLQPSFRYLGYKTGDLPCAERAALEVVSLPLYPELPERDQRVIIKALYLFFS